MSELKETVWFIKRNGANVVVGTSKGNTGMPSINWGLKMFPQYKGELYALYDGVEFSFTETFDLK